MSRIAKHAAFPFFACSVQSVKWKRNFLFQPNKNSKACNRSMLRQNFETKDKRPVHILIVIFQRVSCSVLLCILVTFVSK